MLDYPNIDLEDELDDFIEFAELLIRQHKDLALSVRASMMMALHLTSQKVENDIAKIRRFLANYVFDPYGVDYDHYINKFQHLKTDWDNASFGFFIDDEGDEFDFDIDEAIKRENEELEFRENDDTDEINSVRAIVLGKMSYFFHRVSDSLNEMARNLRGINSDYSKLLKDEGEIEKKVNMLRNVALEDDLWGKFKEEFDDYCNDYIEDNGDKPQSYKKLRKAWMKEKSSFAKTDQYDIELSDRYLFENRDKHTLPDYIYYIYYRECCKLLQQMIDENREKHKKDNFPTSHYSFIKAVSLDEKKRKIAEINKAIVEECYKQCKGKRNCKVCKKKTNVLNAVYVDIIKEINDLPKFSTFDDLFGDSFSITETSYIKIVNDFKKRYHIMKK